MRGGANDDKILLRQKMRTLKQCQTAQNRDLLSAQICQRLLSHPVCCDAHRILLYYALPDEVQTMDLLSAWSGQKELFLPRVEGDNLRVMPYSTENIKQGAFGIWEPVGREADDYLTIDLVIVPGVAFDHQGHRLGRGKGFYDRLLPQLPGSLRIGICFDWQLQELLPVYPHDIAMHYIITESEIIHLS